MASLVEHFLEPQHACPYLPEQTASLEVRVMVEVGAGEFGDMLARGWRRFGPVYFRPACRACTACESLRIQAAGFVASRGQRRARKNAVGLVREVALPVVDDERLELYGRWHAQREGQRGWEGSPLDADRYAFDFAFDHPSVREVTFRDPAAGNRLVGLGIVDEVPGALSAVYFFWDPEHAPASLGVAHVVMLVEEAAACGLAHVYLGFRVVGCPSLAYKGLYRPHELLLGRPTATEEPQWIQMDS